MGICYTLFNHDGGAHIEPSTSSIVATRLCTSSLPVNEHKL